MSYLVSNDIAATHIESEPQPSVFPMKGFIIRGIISGVVLAMTAARSGAPVSDESAIPISVAIMMMLCLELIMGVFSVVAKRTNITGMFRNLIWVVIGNCIGSGLYGFFFVASLTSTLTIATTNLSNHLNSIDGITSLIYTAHQGMSHITELVQQYVLPS